MNLKKFLVFMPLVAGAVVTSCIDDTYNLDDIDTTMQLKVNDLTIPINIDQLEMKNIIDESNQIKVVDGVYSYVHDGTFTSDAFSVPSIYISVGTIKPTKIEFDMIDGMAGIPLPNIDISYKISNEMTSALNFEGEEIDAAVHGISAIYADVVFRITINTTMFRELASYLDLKGIKMILPKNLILESTSVPGSYDPSTGELSIEDFTAYTADNIVLELKFSGLNIDKGLFDPETHTISVHERIGILEGTFMLPAAAIKTGATLPENFFTEISYYVSDFSVDAVSGEIEYGIDGVNIPQVSLGDLPDFLKQDGTDIVFSNPQMYLSATNPLEAYNMFARTGLAITANRTDAPAVTYTTDEPITIGKGGVCVDGHYNFCIAPKMPETPDTSFPSPQFVKFSDLGHILSGNGLPQSIDVKLVDPEIPLQSVEKFRLGVTYPGVDGRYRLVAPFQFQPGSLVVYSERFDDWWDEELDKITIESLEITAEITTDIPVKATATGYPLDRNGNRIAGVEIETSEIPANAANAPLTIRVKMPQGGIRGLGGMEFTVIATSAGGASLSPDMKIKLTKIRPRISGYYQDKF